VSNFFLLISGGSCSISVIGIGVNPTLTSFTGTGFIVIIAIWATLAISQQKCKNVLENVFKNIVIKLMQ
jgi:hypothetical protein